MKAQEELERLILEVWNKEKMSLLTQTFVDNLAQAILKEYVKKSEIELDEEKIIVEIACVVKNQDVLDFEWVKKIAHAIAQNKELIK